MRYKLTTYTYPEDYEFSASAGKTIEAYDPGVPGLLVVARLRWSGESDIRKLCVVMHKATGYNASKECRSIRGAVRIAKEAGKIFDFSKFKTVSGWDRVKKRNPALYKRLKKAAGL